MKRRALARPGERCLGIDRPRAIAHMGIEEREGHGRYQGRSGLVDAEVQGRLPVPGRPARREGFPPPGGLQLPPVLRGTVFLEPVERVRRPTKPGDSSKAVKVDPKLDPKPKNDGPISVECVIDPSKCDRKGKPKPPVDTGDGEPDAEPSKALASAPSTAQIRAAMTPVKPQAKACAARHGGKAGDTVRVKLSVSGPTGKVLSAQALDDHAGTSLGLM